MIITESQMGFGASNGIRLLDNMYYLSESESQYAPAMVPIVENTNVGKYMIALEDLQEFADSNGISDMGYALTCVCEADNLDPSYVGFTIQEENVIAYPDMANMVSNLLNEGVTVLAKPTSDNDPACATINLGMKQLLNTGYSTMLEAAVTNDYYTFFQEAEKTEESKGFMQDYDYNGKSFHQVRSDERTEVAKKYYDEDKKKQEEKKLGTIKSIYEKVKRGINVSRDWIAKQINKLNVWANEIMDKIQSVPSDKRSFFEKVKNKIAQCIEFLTRKLHNFIQARRGNIEARGEYYGSSK